LRRLLRILSCLFFAVLLTFSAGCSKQAKPVKKAAVKKPAPVSRAAVKPVEKKPEKPTVYDYEVRGRRDPFTSLIAIAKAKQKRKKSPNPMENFDVSEIKLTAIVWDSNGYYALITLPDNKSYTLRKGMTLGLYGGKVEQITKDSVMVREQVRNYRGQLETKDTTLRLRKEGEE
jgi:Tfp pilus assembly protein PilP